MSENLNIKITRDIEDIIRIALSDYLTAYCRPYPAEPVLPNILVQQTGGTDDGNDIDSITVVLDARADTEEEAYLTLRQAIGALRVIASSQSTPIRHVVVNTSGSWGADPVNPEIARCSASLVITAHKDRVTLTPKTT